MAKVIFIPWPMPQAQEFLDKSNQWNDALAHDGVAKRFTIVTYQPGSTDATLDAMVDGDIYLRGHGQPGSPFVTTHGANLHIRDSIARLIGMGLKPGFRGKIKFYSCYSGLDGVQKMRATMVTVPKVALGPLKFGTKSVVRDVDKGIFEGSYASLASRGAAIFRGHGFTHCTYFGYPGPLSSQMEARTEETLADGHAHKHCLVVTFDPTGTAVSGSDAASVGRRASAARLQF